MALKDSSFRFRWVEAVTKDKRLELEQKTAQRLVLHSIATFYVKSGQDTFKVRAATIAKRFNVGVATVKRAIAVARAYGYLVLYEPRHHGPGSSDGNGYRLVIPTDIPADLDSPELGISVILNSAVIGDHGDPNWGSTENELGINTNAPTCENVAPLSYNSLVLKSRSASGSADAPHHPPSPEDEEPLKFCSKHPIGTPQGCQSCGEARIAHKAWEERRAARKAAADAAIRAAIDDCPLHCDSYGRDDDLNDCPGHPNFRKHAQESG